MGVTAAVQAALTGGSSQGPGFNVSRVAVLAVLALAVIAGVAAGLSPWWRRRAPRVLGLAAGSLAAVYAVARGIAEFWVVDYSSPASYQHSWGGPSLAGVFAVHTGPGLAVVAAAAVWLLRRRARRRQQRELAGAKPPADRIGA